MVANLEQFLVPGSQRALPPTYGTRFNGSLAPNVVHALMHDPSSDGPCLVTVDRGRIIYDIKGQTTALMMEGQEQGIVTTLASATIVGFEGGVPLVTIGLWSESSADYPVSGYALYRGGDRINSGLLMGEVHRLGDGSLAAQIMAPNKERTTLESLVIQGNRTIERLPYMGCSRYTGFAQLPGGKVVGISFVYRDQRIRYQLRIVGSVGEVDCRDFECTHVLQCQDGVVAVLRIRSKAEKKDAGSREPATEKSVSAMSAKRDFVRYALLNGREAEEMLVSGKAFAPESVKGIRGAASWAHPEQLTILPDGRVAVVVAVDPGLSRRRCWNVDGPHGVTRGPEFDFISNLFQHGDAWHYHAVLGHQLMTVRLDE